MNLPEATYSRLLNQNLVIESLIEGLSEEELNLELYPGKWSIHQQLAHLASYNHTFITRLNIISETFNAKFNPYLADNDPEFLLAVEMPHPYLMEYLDEGRQLVRELLLSYNSSELVRVGIHATYGKLSVVMWTEFFLLHEAHHIYSIFRMVNVMKNMPKR
jgi:hypothetical protein